MPVIRTPEERFANLPDFPFEPHYAELNGLRMHYVDEGQGEVILPLARPSPARRPRRERDETGPRGPFTLGETGVGDVLGQRPHYTRRRSLLPRVNSRRAG